MSEWKETEYGKVPVNWNLISASEYCKKVTDGTHDSPKRQDEGNFLITSKHIKGRNIDFENAYLISKADFCKINERSKVDQWDVIISMIGEYCGFAYLERNSNINYAIKNVGLFKTGDKNNAIWLYYYIQSEIGNYYLQTNKSGTSQPYITLGTLRELPILVPSNIEEQKSIASILSSLDDKIDLLHRQNKTLEAMAETLFRQWFVEEADEGWDSVRISDFVNTNVASINKGNALKTIRYLDTGSLTEGKIDRYETLDIADAPSRARRIVKHNDVLISTVRPNQKHYGILKNPAEDVIVSTGFCVITCDKINPHFIYILLTTDEMTEYLHSIAEGSTSTYPSLKPSDIEGLEFQLPPQEKLDAFSEYADNGWSKIEYNHTQIRTLEKLRDTLLPKLMSGEVKVENENN